MRLPRLQTVSAPQQPAAFSGMPALESGKTLADYWRIVRRHRWSIILLTILGMLIGLFKAGNEIPVFRASLTMVVEPDFSNLTTPQGALVLADSWRFYETQYELLRSRTVAERVVDKLDLTRRSPADLTARTGVVEYLRELLNLESVDGALRAQSVAPGSAAEEKSRKEKFIALIQGGVGVAGSEKSQIVTVSFDSTDAKFAADAANALVDAYVEMGLESRLDRARRTGAWLTEQVEEMRKKVAKSDEELQAYQSREQLVDTKSIEAVSSSKLQTFNQELVTAQGRYSELSKRYGPKHPQMISAGQEVATAQRRLDEASRQIVGSRSKELQLARLERESAANRQLYDAFITKFRETDLSKDYRLTNARIVDRARPPAAPYKPNRAQILSLWGVIGLLMGLGLAFVREHMDNTYKGTQQIEEALNLPALGVVPLLRGSDRSDGVSPERHYLAEKRSAFAEAVNHIRTGILYSNVDNPPKVVLVSSAVQGEGKTTLSTNLAMSFAQLGRTLLIDADLRKPRVKVTTSAAEGGLVDYVAGVKTLQQCVTSDPQCPNLFILKSGVIPPNPLELLSSKKLASTIAELRDKFEHIVLDTAPILPVSDAIVLGHIVDGLILVVQAGRTTHSLVQDAVRRLDAASVTPLGVVLTKLEYRKSHYYYDGKYQYYRNYYGDSPKAKKA
jgi:capsular exopolysaccharide synthesis family protein